MAVATSPLSSDMWTSAADLFMKQYFFWSGYRNPSPRGTFFSIKKRDMNPSNKSQNKKMSTPEGVDFEEI